MRSPRHSQSKSKDYIVELSQKGLSTSQIALRLGVSVSSVGQTLRSRNIDFEKHVGVQYGGLHCDGLDRHRTTARRLDGESDGNR